MFFRRHAQESIVIMSRIYINTRQQEELRVVIAENGRLVGFEQDIPGWENRKGDIYKAVVTRVEEGLDAAFVDFGEGKNGFLPLKNVADNLPGASGGKHKVAEGDSILVQIKKDHVGDKGAGMTTSISLAGCYLVLMPGHHQKARVSKNVEGRERQQAVDALSRLRVPDNMGVILRTAGVGRTAEDLRWDLESYLLKLWGLIESAAEANRGPILIYRENNLTLRAVRDYFRPGEDEIYCDDADNYRELKEFISLISPEHADSVFHHDSGRPLVPDDIEEQIDAIYERGVKTPSGARVVFDITEAMAAVDVNSAQMQNQTDIEATALRANLEAAEIVARHLRLRDLGGLIVVDFIDMLEAANRRKLEETFVRLLRKDRARVQWTSLSAFGMMEISRQRLSRPVEEWQSVLCHTCHGTGRRHRPESFALRLLRRMRSLLNGGDVGTLVAQAPADTAVYLLNEKRVELRRLEDEYECEIVVVPVADMYPPDFNIRKIKKESLTAVSYESAPAGDKNQAEMLRRRLQKKAPRRPPLINTMMPEEREQAGAAAGFASKVAGFFKSLFGGGDDGGEDDKRAEQPRSRRGRRGRKNGAGGGDHKKAASPQPRGQTAVEMAAAVSHADKKKKRRRPQRRKAGEGASASALGMPSGDSSAAANAGASSSGKTAESGNGAKPPSSASSTTAAKKTDGDVSKKSHAPSGDKGGDAKADGKTLSSSDSNSDSDATADKRGDGYVQVDGAAKPGGSLLSRLAAEHNKSEAEVRRALSAIGGDGDMAADAHSEIMPEMEEALTKYFSAPIAPPSDSGLKMVESDGSGDTPPPPQSQVRVLEKTEPSAPVVAEPAAAMRQVETAKDKP